ncbi:MAG: hypothetical protein ACE5QF_09385 [Thermoplasmata archaeon]
MPGEKVTISAKIPRALRDSIDRIGRDLGITNRSILLREAPSRRYTRLRIGNY